MSDSYWCPQIIFQDWNECLEKSKSWDHLIYLSEKKNYELKDAMDEAANIRHIRRICGEINLKKRTFVGYHSDYLYLNEILERMQTIRDISHHIQKLRQKSNILIQEFQSHLNCRLGESFLVFENTEVLDLILEGLIKIIK